MVDINDKNRRVYDLVADRVLDQMGRLLLYTEKLPEGETEHWMVVDTKRIYALPPVISPARKLHPAERNSSLTIRYKDDNGNLGWPSKVFCRIEAGVENSTLQKEMDRIRSYWLGRMVNHRVSQEQAYKDAIMAFPDAMFAK